MGNSPCHLHHPPVPCQVLCVSQVPRVFPPIWGIFLRISPWTNRRNLPGLVNLQKAIENGHRNSGFTHWTWWFSIVMWTFTGGYVMWFTRVKSLQYHRDIPLYLHYIIICVGWITINHHQFTVRFGECWWNPPTRMEGGTVERQAFSAFPSRWD